MLRRYEVYAIAPDAPADAVEQFAEAARDCARYIPEVVYSAIGRFTGQTPLNFAWEHAYASPADYVRYMEHHFHAAKLDRYLMADSAERITVSNDAGIGLFGYRCATPEFFMPGGARRVVALRAIADAQSELARFVEAERGGTRISVLAENWFGPRWSDGETCQTLSLEGLRLGRSDGVARLRAAAGFRLWPLMAARSTFPFRAVGSSSACAARRTIVHTRIISPSTSPPGNAIL